MSIEDFIITVYCLVEENMATVVGNRRLRQRGFAPKLTDSEVITLEVVGEFLGLDADKGIWCYFREHWLAWFPALGSRTAFVKQSSHLWRVKQQMQALLVKSLGGYDDILHMVDGFPIPLCQLTRAPRGGLFKEEASYGYCASKATAYYGFKGNLMIAAYYRNYHNRRACRRA